MGVKCFVMVMAVLASSSANAELLPAPTPSAAAAAAAASAPPPVVLTSTLVPQLPQQPQQLGDTKPGACPTLRHDSMCTEVQTCSSDINCPGTHKCCPMNCGGTICTARAEAEDPLEQLEDTKPGTCPTLRRGSMCTEVQTCNSDVDCPDTRKCCPMNCGGTICKARAEDPHPGMCPEPKEHRTPWHCGTDMCARDSDCRFEGEKCCMTRCGALACTTPDRDGMFKIKFGGGHKSAKKAVVAAAIGAAVGGAVGHKVGKSSGKKSAKRKGGWGK